VSATSPLTPDSATGTGPEPSNSQHDGQRPSILVACRKNAGRSVAGKVLLEYYGRGRVGVRSAGSTPGDHIHPEVAAELAARGLSTDAETPTLLTREGVEEADVVITMGCGEACPYVPGKRYLDWEVEDPAGQDPDTVRRIVDDIDARVRGLLQELVPAIELPPAPAAQP
jgi:arsenate reductase